MSGESLHKGSVAILAGMAAPYIGIDRIVAHRNVGLGDNIFGFDFFDKHLIDPLNFILYRA
jgi:hypothetical protein